MCGSFGFVVFVSQLTNAHFPLDPGWDNALESRTGSSPLPQPAAPLRPTLAATVCSLYLPLRKREHLWDQCKP